MKKEKVLIHENSGSAEQMAALLSKDAQSSYTRLARPISIKIDVLDLATIEAMSKFSGNSRNKIIGYLLSAGIEATMEHLDEETAKRFKIVEKEFFAEFMSDDQAKENIIDEEKA